MEGKGKGVMRENECRSMVLYEGASSSRVKRSCSPSESEGESEDEEELMLTLDLSLNGKFGVDPTRKQLKRSSSALNLELDLGVGCSADYEGERQARGVVIGPPAPLERTSLMPLPLEWRPWEESERLRNVDARVAREGLANWHLSHLLRGASAAESSSTRQFVGETSARRVPTVSPDFTDLMHQRNILVDMPHVFTTGCGPHQDKIEGFLYRFKNGERVKIVCVCHGMFFTPEDFVRHGGSDCENPLKHIAVTPFPLY